MTIYRQPWCTPFPIWNQSVVPCLVLIVASWPAYRFLKRQVRSGGILVSNLSVYENPVIMLVISPFYKWGTWEWEKFDDLFKVTHRVSSGSVLHLSGFEVQVLSAVLCSWLKTVSTCHGFTGVGEGNGNPFQYSYLENLMDRGAWWATVHGVTRSQTWLKPLNSKQKRWLRMPTDFPPFIK